MALKELKKNETTIQAGEFKKILKEIILILEPNQNPNTEEYEKKTLHFLSNKKEEKINDNHQEIKKIIDFLKEKKIITLNKNDDLLKDDLIKLEKNIIGIRSKSNENDDLLNEENTNKGNKLLDFLINLKKNHPDITIKEQISEKTIGLIKKLKYLRKSQDKQKVDLNETDESYFYLNQELIVNEIIDTKENKYLSDELNILLNNSFKNIITNKNSISKDIIDFNCIKELASSLIFFYENIKKSNQNNKKKCQELIDSLKDSLKKMLGNRLTSTEILEDTKKINELISREEQYINDKISIAQQNINANKISIAKENIDILHSTYISEVKDWVILKALDEYYKTLINDYSELLKNHGIAENEDILTSRQTYNEHQNECKYFHPFNTDDLITSLVFACHHVTTLKEAIENHVIGEWKVIDFIEQVIDNDPCSSLKNLMTPSEYENLINEFFLLMAPEENLFKLNFPTFDEKPKKQFHFSFLKNIGKRKKETDKDFGQKWNDDNDDIFTF